MGRTRFVFLQFVVGVTGLLAQGGDCLVQSKQAGAVRLGMTLTQAKQVLHGATFQPAEDADHMPILTVLRGGARVMDLYTDVDEPRKDRAKIELIRVYDPKCATAEGVHPGMLLADVEKRYGNLLRLERTDVESREYAEFEKLPSWVDLQTGKGEAGVYTKNMRCAPAYVPAAKVESLWVSQPRTNTRYFMNDSECVVPTRQ